MQKYIIGFVAGLATYHFALNGLQNQELISDVRSTLQKVDERLAETQQNVAGQGATKTSRLEKDPS